MGRDEIGKFIDAVVEDPAGAELMLETSPGLLNARWIHDETVLHFLVVESFLDGVRSLIAHGAQVDAVNEFGDTALIDAVVLGNVPIAQVLLGAGANPNAPSRSNENPLMAAVTSGKAALVDMLLEAGASHESVGALDQTILVMLVTDPGVRSALLEVLAKHGIRL